MHFRLYFVLGLAMSATAHAGVTETVDRFSGKRTIVLSPDSRSIGAPPGLTLVTVQEGNKPAMEFAVILEMASTKWRYMDCHTTYWLADDKPVPLPPVRHEGKLGDGIVMEFLRIDTIPRTALETFAAARKVEFKICNDEFVLPDKARADIAELLRKSGR